MLRDLKLYYELPKDAFVQPALLPFVVLDGVAPADTAKPCGGTPRLPAPAPPAAGNTPAGGRLPPGPAHGCGPPAGAAGVVGGEVGGCRSSLLPGAVAAGYSGGRAGPTSVGLQGLAAMCCRHPSLVGTLFSSGAAVVPAGALSEWGHGASRYQRVISTQEQSGGAWLCVLLRELAVRWGDVPCRAARSAAPLLTRNRVLHLCVLPLDVMRAALRRRGTWASGCDTGTSSSSACCRPACR